MKYYHYYDGMKCKQVKVAEFRNLEAIARMEGKSVLITFGDKKKYIAINDK